jgi:hypothetical protein
MTSPTDVPTFTELDAELGEAIAAELHGRRAGIVDDQVAAMNKIRLLRGQIEQLRRDSK